MSKLKKADETRPDTDEVLDLLDSFQASSALCAAMEFGLFWHLGQGIKSGEEIARSLNIPLNRCRYWLQYLCKLGLLEHSPEGFSVTEEARSSILDSYSRKTWVLLAKESMEQFPVFQFLTSHFQYPGSLWEVGGLDAPKYVERMNEEPGRARAFTRMLFELHQELAETIANLLDMRDINQFMDLGGGSGVLSMALLRRNAHLSAMVVDIPNVCIAGRELAVEHSLEDRLSFHPADFIHDELPKGFDMVIECDVGVYSEQLFKKVRSSLNPGGRFVIIDQFAPAKGMAPYSRVLWGLQRSLEDPDFSYPTAREIVSELEESGYHSVTSLKLPKIESDASQFTDDLYIIDSHV
jgi:SAM-dependent methyltransferase